jgi:hypothetical protein
VVIDPAPGSVAVTINGGPRQNTGRNSPAHFQTSVPSLLASAYVSHTYQGKHGLSLRLMRMRAM